MGLGKICTLYPDWLRFLIKKRVDYKGRGGVKDLTICFFIIKYLLWGYLKRLWLIFDILQFKFFFNQCIDITIFNK